MVEKTREVKLTNRDNGSVGYTIPDLNLRREFSPGETKTVTFDEIEKLAWTRGGLPLLRNFLIIEDPEAAEEVLGEIEPEYYYTDETVKTLLTNGTLEQLQDTLDFAPKGVVDLIKKEAVELPLNNVAMRKEIKTKTNFDVDRAIEINEASKIDENDSNAATSKRRATPIAASNEQITTGRKSTPIIIKK